MTQPALSVVDRLLGMDKQQRRANNPFARRRRSKRERRVRLSRKGLIDYLLDNDIHSTYKLKKVRKPGDPKPYDYYKEFGPWENVRLEAWGDLDVITATPMDDPAYHLRVIRDWGLYSVVAYRKARAKSPGIVPSFRKLTTHWGTFSKAVEASLRTTLKGKMNTFLILYERLGRMPTAKECREAHIEVEDAVEVFGGSMKALKEFLACIGRLRGNKNANRRRSPSEVS
jgi:hypothetical protein